MEATTATTVATIATDPSIMNTIAIYMTDGGIFMWVILFVWIVGLAIGLEKFVKLAYRYDVDGASFMNELQRYILSNDIQGAIRACSGTNASLPRVLKSGLKRATSSISQMQNALDATALEVIPKLEVRLNWMQLVATISTLFGLLGTIQGLIQAFGSISSADPAQKAQILSAGISTAMYTTFIGLLSAITVMIFHTFLASKAEKIIAEIDEYSVKLLDLIGTKDEKEK
ncbi:MAG: hypothetical protein A2504_05585 [Bdellovibrionales bacterium RIFOXYD12_FULL_39_22]|nr:MAG: hypothetical protein A2385_06240 [Bdellovibrionales bacterium RIFOXYB1_FULL_39_21]OFZ41878.1 MAG: hypothetical protein A2485_08210 [Bdellovibrionales bacterium RIFOXYC12_FULL_39_17]OFZ50594.1 MAG: hypothetical protein A2404_05160 [Bdellovibrionales bacterium RIFOXYC1_FULL_39_130]OFZ77817.1 MAG: hypothetical protein A2560_00330 [Bdellovibrionales bacterium RIFOXYD1_FULL_39_84]OFZ93747.1 MAG: hypothetical protein A2504_05585 [Bdellovibrionales bacterium RIFOXYD12_FULL_39_22]HLE11568.1 Mo